MHRILLVLALCSTVCSGCYNVTPAQMRTEHGLHSQFTVDGSMQTVVKNIRNKTNECKWDMPDRVTLLEELGEAQIEYRSVAGVDVLLFLVDLRIKDGKTSIDIYTMNKMHEKFFRVLEYGAKGLPGCP